MQGSELTDEEDALHALYMQALSAGDGADTSRAVALFKQAAYRGHMWSLHALGYMFDQHLG